MTFAGRKHDRFSEKFTLLIPAMSVTNPQITARNFLFAGEIISVLRHGSGKINDTFLVTTSTGKFILQCLNPRVFKQPELVMRNLRTIETHITNRLREDTVLLDKRWEVPRIISTLAGTDLFHDPEGNSWRAITFIDNATAHETIQNAGHARQAGLALGRFHRLLNDLPVEKLHDTLPDFHVTPRYLEKFDALASAPLQQPDNDGEIAACQKFIAGRRTKSSVLEDALQHGALQLRPIHGDPKLSNIMIDTSTAEAVGFVDLDTVKPGLIHYDVGDCLRSCCNFAGEEGAAAGVHFDTDTCRTILQGYMEEAATFLSPVDLNFFYDAIWLIPFELGIRFLTDHLSGDVYFKTDGHGQNLQRALVQFSLCRSIEEQEETVRAIINALPRN